jgi:hypothetical protein
VWTGGFSGLVLGGTVGFIASWAAVRIARPKWWVPRRHTLLVVLLSAAGTSFWGSMVGGKLAISSLADIWEKRGTVRPYEQKRRAAVEAEGSKGLTQKAAHGAGESSHTPDPWEAKKVTLA